MDAVMVMGNSHLVMRRSNRLAIIASHSQESRFLYPGKHWKLGSFAESGDVNSAESTSSGSKDAGRELKSRILVIKAAEDSAAQYMNFMNVIFAAQKQNILIDACVLDSESGLLQQASDITGGLYLKIPQIQSLSQYLLWVFLPDPEQRSKLVLPPPVHVDYRAACFCHRNLIEIGYVCSVCLSIFCNFSPICTTCETAFRIALPPILKTKKKKSKLPTLNYLTS
ncbi:general transcription factor IIH subunit 3 isoform X6 [Scyliorhinus torazame]|uniref:general transcription factor IIH subunit 3 isoform X6 n=1 Tax=Scyliorhinus torazame TaxID=75743 RepID=UPI003B5AAAEA